MSFADQIVRHGWWAAAAVFMGFGLAGCGAGSAAPREAPEGRRAEAAAVALHVSTVSAPAGSRISMTLGPAAVGKAHRLLALQARLRFDPQALRYAGQLRDSGSFTMVAPQALDDGTLRLAGFSTDTAVGASATLVFDVLRADYAGGSSAVVEVAKSVDGTIRRGQVIDPSGERAERRNMMDARTMTLDDWRTLASSSSVHRSVISARPGEGVIYGDADLNGQVDVNDALSAALVSVTLEPLLTNLATDYAIATNVEPANAPGIGGANDDVPPGREPDGTYVVNVLDALEIALYSVGNGGPVTGQRVPGRTLAVQPAVTLSGVVAGTRQLSADTLYRLSGRVIVPRGASLSIAPGTRIVALAPAAGVDLGQLVVRQGGILTAVGTRLLPIVFTCDGIKVAGCWRGVVINGAALLNNDGVTSNVVSCPTRQAPDGAGIYGGCLVEDASGSLRYVRIEFGGAASADGGPGAALSLNGVGSGTTIDSTQVANSAGDGIAVSGGRARLRSVMISNSGLRGLTWSDGWQGLVQGLIVQHGTGSSRAAIAGSNFGPNPDAGPRSAPTLYGVTLVGPRLAANGPTAILMTEGSAATIANSIVIGFRTGFDIDGTASCARAADSLIVRQTFFDDNQFAFATDADCADEVAIGLAAPLDNRLASPELIAPYQTQSADLRPAAGTASATAPAPPTSGFFDPLLRFFGAVPPANATRTNVPWYAGWTAGF